MKRREFLEKLMLFYAGAIATAPVFKILPANAQEKAGKSLVVVGENKDYVKLVKRVVNSLGGMSKFVKKGDKVVVKPNIAWDRNVEQGANTHPTVVKTIVQLALAAGASEVKVFDRPCNEERRCYNNSGVKAAVESIESDKAKIEYVDHRKFVNVKIERGNSLDEWEFYKVALEADTYINVPIAKHHGLARLTLGLKNTMGVLGGRRGRIHNNLGQNLAEINTVVQPDLTIIDATRILLRNGPQGGSLDDVKVLHTLVASTDIVAADAYSTTLFDLEPEEIPATKAAYELGMGEMDLSKVKIVTVT
jgi:uncharacterized protein (DUF362 family)